MNEMTCQDFRAKVLRGLGRYSSISNMFFFSLLFCMLIPWEQFPLKVNPYSEGKQNNFDRVGSPANVSIPPKINKRTPKLIQSDIQQAPNTKGKERQIQ